jgi:hypothetical protein
MSHDRRIRLTRRRRLWWKYLAVEDDLARALKGNQASKRQVLAWGCWIWLAILIPVAVAVLTVLVIVGR